MNFRHLLEKHLLARQFFDAVSQRLCEAGFMMKQGSPSSRPKLHQEQVWRVCPRDAPDQERQSMVFRHEDPYRH